MAASASATSTPSAYIWDTENQLFRIAPPGDDLHTGDRQVEFVYDYLGRQVEWSDAAACAPGVDDRLVQVALLLAQPPQVNDAGGELSKLSPEFQKELTDWICVNLWPARGCSRTMCVAGGGKESRTSGKVVRKKSGR